MEGKDRGPLIKSTNLAYWFSPGSTQLPHTAFSKQSTTKPPIFKTMIFINEAPEQCEWHFSPWTILVKLEGQNHMSQTSHTVLGSVNQWHRGKLQMLFGTKISKSHETLRMDENNIKIWLESLTTIGFLPANMKCRRGYVLLMLLFQIGIFNPRKRTHTEHWVSETTQVFSKGNDWVNFGSHSVLTHREKNLAG